MKNQGKSIVILLFIMILLGICTYSLYNTQYKGEYIFGKSRNISVEKENIITKNIEGFKNTKDLIETFKRGIIAFNTDNDGKSQCFGPINKNIEDKGICNNSINTIINDNITNELYTIDNIVGKQYYNAKINTNQIFLYTINNNIDSKNNTFAITTILPSDMKQNEKETLLKNNISLVNLYGGKEYNTTIPCTIDDINTENIIIKNNNIIYYDYKSIINGEKSLIKKGSICDLYTEYGNLGDEGKKDINYLKTLFSNHQQGINESVTININ